MEIEINKKGFTWAIIGFFTLIAFYFAILSLLNSSIHAIEEFTKMWYWILLLAIGFGTQVGLFVYVRESIKALNANLCKNKSRIQWNDTSNKQCCGSNCENIWMETLKGGEENEWWVLWIKKIKVFYRTLNN